MSGEVGSICNLQVQFWGCLNQSSITIETDPRKNSYKMQYINVCVLCDCDEKLGMELGNLLPSLVPRPFPPPVFQYVVKYWRWERPGNEVT